MSYILTIKSSLDFLKYQLFAEDDKELSSGCLDEIKSYQQAVKQVLREIRDLHQVTAVGHYVADGGEEFIKPVVIDNLILSKLAEWEANIDNIAGIRVFLEYLDVPQIAVFDTAFFNELSWILKPNLTYHGLAHQGAVFLAAQELKKKESEINPAPSRRVLDFTGRCGINIISCYLDESCSVAVIKKGKPIDVSEKFSLAEDVENEQDYAGWLRQATFNKDAKLALDTFVLRVKKHIGASLVVLGSEVDALVLSGFIINSRPTIKQKIMSGLDFLGKKAKVLTVNSGEGLMIARETKKTLTP